MTEQRKKKTLLDFYNMKKRDEKVVWITGYSAPQARFCEQAGVDMILIGDSGGMCLLGYDSTIPVTMEEMIIISKAVRRGAPNTWIIGDMPFMSYQKSNESAVENAGRFIKAGCDSIKLEGGKCVCSQIRAITDAGIVVYAHLGMTPQSSNSFGGYKAQGRTVNSARAIIEDAYAVQEAGAKFLLLEAVPPEISLYLAEQLDIPVYGIGGGMCDGQLLIISDVIGEFQLFTPKFVKKYASIADTIVNAITEYKKDVQNKTFPEDPLHCYHIFKKHKEGIEKLMEELAKKPKKEEK
ncbi:3-methyl-2-oxobutanoate hydroxymethyltransferase [Anaeramoeba flamelloides]|uniref:3-methyl-2-oxobutanoate hydroxymethyltransferase n=1 Tax=Anaeramoeba flamelloides TaxID=1746091 RepID=A0AAV7YQK0_9EUKA|nr:3-methyl-2-oxobutanoate hydroxymethyltransferase [Anaeramoeba flamelloides]|eukprot:Anaeramoba_flamelloidesa1053810_1299.p1 GENE.a1053810_1299~~a1053810_1299.p1  ORF type:complete len:295 (+),score=78.40 a1053810_1299:25-909(+)